MTYTAGDQVEVLVLTRRGKQGEWVPAVVTTVNPDRIEVTFEGGSRQRFEPATERLRIPAAGEGALWVF